MKTSEAIEMIENDWNLKFIDTGNDLYTLESHQCEIVMRDPKGNICSYGITSTDKWEVATEEEIQKIRDEYNNED